MQTVHYSKLRLCLMGVAILLLFIVGFFAWATGQGKVAFAGAIMTIAGIWGLFMVLRYLIGGGLILEYDRQFVTFHGMIGVVRLPWDEVTGVETVTQTYNWIGRNRFLKIKGRFSLLGHASITERLLERQHRPIEKLLDQIVDHLEQPEAVIRPPRVVLQQSAGSAMPPSRVPGGIGNGTAPQMRGGGFGRKGL